MTQIRLIIDRQKDDYTAKWVDANGPLSDSFPLVLPMNSDNVEELRWYLEEFMQFPLGGERTKAAAVERKLKTWGEALFNALFGTVEGTHVYNNFMRDPEPRLLTIGTTDADALGQPWEMMRDKRGPLAFRGVVIRRQLQGSGMRVSYDFGLPLRILLIVSRPTDTGFIDPRTSLRPVMDALDELPDLAQLDFCEPPTFARLEEMVSAARAAQEPYHIVHFDGHGTYLPRTGVGALAFERDNGQSELIAGTRMGDLLSRLEVPLVILEACRSADLSQKPVFGSVAPALLQSGVGSVVAFSHAVHVEAAKLLVERFYRQLADSRSVGQALEEGRTRIHANRTRWLSRGPNAETIDLQDWFIPQLYQIGPDPTLIPSATPSPRGGEGRGEEIFHNFPPPPRYRFHGRAAELLELERAFRRHNAVLFSGMGGMGKTALAREAAAWELRKGRFSAAVFHSFEQKAGAERVVQLLGAALRGEDFPALSADERWETAVNLFHQTPVLLVWDNFESTLPIYQNDDQTSDFLKKSDVSEATAFSDDARAQLHKLYAELTGERNGKRPQGRLLVTCRPQETGLQGLKELPLRGLARPDSLYLLAAILDQKSIDVTASAYDRDEMADLLAKLDDHPLSIELVAPHLRQLTPAQIVADYDQLLPQFSDDDAYEGRNRSLLASLAFSQRRLSEAAQQVWPYLGWFDGGAFEASILAFAEIAPETWAAVRAELVETALIRVEELDGFNTPYLRFHPTLADAARLNPAEGETTAARFVAVYWNVMELAGDLLRGQHPALGMALTAREEANLRRAAAIAFKQGKRAAGGGIAETLNVYLQRAGRLRERNALTAWTKAQLAVPDDDLPDDAACEAIWRHAWTLFTQGQAAQAIEEVQGLIETLQNNGLRDGADPTFQIALGYRSLGRVYVRAGRFDLAVALAKQAINLFEKLPGEAAQGNLAAALGDLANAYKDLGQLDEALRMAEHALVIDREIGRDREIAVGLTQIAQILTEQNRYGAAEHRYEEALAAAQGAGDKELEGSIIQWMGILHGRQGEYGRAVTRYREALNIFQQVGEQSSQMRTCDLLASAEQQRGQLDAAATWYNRAHELAQKLGDRGQLAVVAQNRGILYQTRAKQAADNTHRTAYLRQAAASVAESLAIKLEMGNQVGAASSYGQLGQIYRLLGEFDKAEENTLQTVRIYESLNLPEVYMPYGDMAALARGRGDAAAAAQWQAKREAKLAELEALRRADAADQAANPLANPQLAQFILALAQAAYQARSTNAPLPPDVEEAIAQLMEQPGPLGQIGLFLSAVAANEPIPAIPPGLPPQLAQILQSLVEALS
ncbi:tetratricopeptide repeat protein [Candidatus Leptofilum sp.]|uniref:tetratricopeptide repeat protein n=1 Tax=Candidatus Leptofilum sp. TaxID=3241576 RepID=UPI003B59211F